MDDARAGGVAVRISGKIGNIARSGVVESAAEARLPWLTHLRGGIAARLLFYVLLFSSAVTLVLTAAQLYLNYRYDIGVIERRLDEIEKGYLGSLAEGLWQVDQRQLELQLKGIASLPDIAYVEVRESGTSSSTPLVVKAGHRNGDAVLRRELPIVYQSAGGPQAIGEFIIEANLKGVYHRLIQSGLVILVTQGAKTFLVSIFIVFIFYRLVGRHLSMISREVEAYDLWHPSAPMRLQRTTLRESDELDRVVAAFNALCAKLQHSHDELKRANTDLQRDVAARIAAEEALRESEERFHDYALAASDWFWETGPDHRFTYVSRRMGDHGLEPGAVIGRFRWDIAVDHDEETEKWREHKALIERHEPFRGLTYRIARTDGQQIFVESNGQPVFDAAGLFKGYRGIGRDVTETVRADRVLREARDEAEEASRAKSHFLANMSHELRTPLNAIIGLSEMIHGQVLGEDFAKYREYAGDIQVSGRHLLGIINEVLDIAKIEAGKYTLEESEVDLKSLAEEAVRILALEAERHGLALVMELGADLPRVRGDAGALRRILFNLLSNALKFTPRGGRVVLAAARSAEGIAIGVSDTGIGIAKEHLATVTKPFVQVEGAYQRRHGGTGLGLAIVQALADLHGGSLTIESVVDRGTLVRVTLPASRIIQD